MLYHIRLCYIILYYVISYYIILYYIIGPSPEAARRRTAATCRRLADERACITMTINCYNYNYYYNYY